MSSVPGEAGMTSARFLRATPRVIASGAAAWFDARGMARMTVVAGAGATVTWDRVSGPTSMTAIGTTITPPEAGAAVVLEVEWPWYYVTTTGGTATVALV